MAVTEHYGWDLGLEKGCEEGLHGGWAMRICLNILPEASLCAGDRQEATLVTVASSLSLVLLFG